MTDLGGPGLRWGLVGSSGATPSSSVGALLGRSVVAFLLFNLSPGGDGGGNLSYSFSVSILNSSILSCDKVTQRTRSNSHFWKLDASQYVCVCTYVYHIHFPSFLSAFLTVINQSSVNLSINPNTFIKSLFCIRHNIQNSETYLPTKNSSISA